MLFFLVYLEPHPRRSTIIRYLAFPAPAVLPGSATSVSLVSKSFPYLVTSLLPYFLFSKFFTSNIYEPPRKCCKQKTYTMAKSL